MESKRPTRPSQLRVWFLVMTAWVVAVFLALRFGGTPLVDWQIIQEIRLPRVILAAAVGMGLSVAGAILQVLFANPLCEPYTLGISSGSALGAVLGAALGWDWVVAGMALNTFAGALLFTLVLFAASKRLGTSTLTLLLAGVSLGFLGSSLVALCVALSDSNGIQGALIWLLGDLSRARFSGSVATLWGVVSLTFWLWLRRAGLDALLLGEEGALTLGYDSRRIRTELLFVVSLLVALCVSAAGMIGFVGLMVPHFSRRWVGSLHGRLLPMTAALGGTVVTYADTLARTIHAPYEIPVGVVTALIGAPLFLLLMLRRGEVTRG